jgi:HD-like signal output (HDOD) protein
VNQSILKEIKSLPPLPEVVLEVNRICSNPKSSLVDLAEAVKKDPVATATILKVVNSPLYSLKEEVKTIDRAVTMFGKAATKAFILNSAIENSFNNIDVSSYNMELSDYSETAQKRSSLMIKWFSKVSFTKLNILATTALVGNIGQLVISKEIANMGKVEEFQSLLEYEEVDIAEREIAGISSEEVTASILEYWSLDKILVDSIKYATSIDALNSVDDEVAVYAKANFIIYNAIDVTGNTDPDKLEMIKEILIKDNLKVDHFLEVLEGLQQ